MTEETNQEVVDTTALQVGDIVTGEVTKVDDKQVLVNVGYKTDGVVPISELCSVHIETASDVVSAGDTLQLKVIKLEETDLVLSKKAVDAANAWSDLHAKFENGEIFDVVVRDVVNGGLVVDLGVRGFIPASLVEKHFVEDFSDYKGKELAVKIVELDEEKNRVILSHRAVVEDELQSKKKDAVESLKVGSVMEGTVQRLTDFGAFIDLGGVDGLVHISQLSYKRVEKPSDVLAEGQQVKVKVLAVDVENGRISLSMKAAEPGPWDSLDEEVQVGAILKGTVRRLVNFGAFVEVLPHIEGLVHVSQIANKHVKNPNEVLELGQIVQVKVLELNKEEKRISLSIKEAQEEEIQVDLGKYQPTQETTGFQLGELLGDKLKNFGK
jgi:small subunit ribosomal protein S1